MANRLLVSTYRSLLLVDGDTGERSVVHTGRGLYYGITWSREELVVSARWYPWYMPTSQIERPRRLVFNRELKLVREEEFGQAAGGVHQAHHIDGETWHACSREDGYLLETVDGTELWHPSLQESHHGHDTHHFNSVWVNEEMIYLVGHNRGPSDIWIFDRANRNLHRKIRIGAWAHNVWRQDGALTVCNSRFGVIESEGGKVLAETGGFPRGVAVTPEAAYVGVSGIGHRSMRWAGTSELVVFDRQWTPVKRISLGRNGGVLEVRALDRPDICHNGISFSEVCR